MLVYRGMDVGTAKPSASVRGQVPHHMIDLVEPDQGFNAAEFCRLARRAIDGIVARGGQPLLVCGSPLYLKALLWGLFDGPGAAAEFRQRLRRQAAALGTKHLHRRLALADPVAADRIDPNDLRRIERALEVHELTGEPISSRQRQFEGPCRLGHVAVGLRWPRPALYDRIQRRVDAMMAAGLLEEVRGLAGRMGRQASQAIGYRELLAHLRGELALEEAVGLIKRNTRRLAKHQMTWLRHFPAVDWIEMAEEADREELVRRCEFLFEGLIACRN